MTFSFSSLIIEITDTVQVSTSMMNLSVQYAEPVQVGMTSVILLRYTRGIMSCVNLFFTYRYYSNQSDESIRTVLPTFTTYKFENDSTGLRSRRYYKSTYCWTCTYIFPQQVDQLFRLGSEIV